MFSSNRAITLLNLTVGMGREKVVQSFTSLFYKICEGHSEWWKIIKYGKKIYKLNHSPKDPKYPPNPLTIEYITPD